MSLDGNSTRRNFLKPAAAAAAYALGGESMAAIKDGLFLMVGSDDEVMAYSGAGTKVIDAG